MNLLNKRVSIEFKDKKIPDAVNLLNKKLGNIFSYRNNILPNQKTISLIAKDEFVKSVLEKIFKDTDIRFFQVGDQIILKKYKSENEKEKIKKKHSDESNSFNKIYINEFDELSYLPPLHLTSNETRTGISKYALVQYTITETPECASCDTVPGQADYSDIPVYKKRGNNSLLFSPGFKTNSKTSIIANKNNISSNLGVTTMFAYGYMFADTWQWNIQVGVFVAEANVSDTVVSAKVIIPFLFGIRNYPDFLALSDFGNVYVGASIGAYMGSGSVISSNSGVVSQVETKLGVSLNLGLDIYPFSWLKMGPNVTFHLFGNYSKIIQESTNFSGTEFSFNMGLVF
jgi:hypothetical protein